ncbi:MAG: ribose-phosphate pyrophosphokinase [Clostridiales bacterium]|jgi:ribose-phosphate pyrophosphokinase|nr:ribose-phosphate pyrophosphokinase [Clostridiales bacterium]
MNIHGKGIKIFSGSANRDMAQEIARKIGVPLGALSAGRFSDGEVSVNIGEVVRGSDVYIVQSTCMPVNENLVELLVIMDAMRRASAGRITAVIPYFGYARQDRKAKARDPISAKLVANLLTVAGADRVLTMDLHTPQIQGFFDIPVDHLLGAGALAEYFAKLTRDPARTVAVSPDAGSANRTRYFAEYLDVSIAIGDKRRAKQNECEIIGIIGDVKDKTCIIFDDVIDTGGTIVKTAEVLMELGAAEVYAACTHGVFSGDAVSKLQNSCLKEVVLLNTIPLPEEKRAAKIRQLSISHLFAEAIERIYGDKSISTLFDVRHIRDIENYVL